MDIGMLWFDNDKQADLNSKVKRAVTYYQQKYGRKPNLCFVNPSMMVPMGANGSNGNGNKSVASAEGVEIRESKSMLPNHLWIGINQRETGAAAP